MYYHYVHMQYCYVLGVSEVNSCTGVLSSKVKLLPDLTDIHGVYTHNAMLNVYNYYLHVEGPTYTGSYHFLC